MLQLLPWLAVRYWRFTAWGCTRFSFLFKTKIGKLGGGSEKLCKKVVVDFNSLHLVFRSCLFFSPWPYQSTGCDLFFFFLLPLCPDFFSFNCWLILVHPFMMVLNHVVHRPRPDLLTVYITSLTSIEKNKSQSYFLSFLFPYSLALPLSSSHCLPSKSKKVHWEGGLVKKALCLPCKSKVLSSFIQKTYCNPSVQETGKERFLGQALQSCLESSRLLRDQDSGNRKQLWERTLRVAMLKKSWA